MQSMSHGADRPPRGWKNWTIEDYRRDPRAMELRELCIDALRALIAHQRGGASERDELMGLMGGIQQRFSELEIHPGMHSDKGRYYPTTSPLAMVECRAAELMKLCGQGVPSQQAFLVNLEDATVLSESDSTVHAEVDPNSDGLEFVVSQMYLTICTNQLDANEDVG